MQAPTLNPNDQPPATPSQSGVQPQPRVPLRTKWPRLKKKVREERLREEIKERFGYYPHNWQMQAALKVLEGNDGVVVAGTGKGKTMVFALLGLAVKLSKTKGHYIIVSPLKALEGDQVARMKKAKIKAAALNENTSQKDFSKAFDPDKGSHLIFASPEYLLRNPRLKKFYADEEARTRILGVLVDEGHVIHEWAESFRKDYYELKTLRVILGNNVPWWALSATFTNQIFKTVYKTLSFGTSRPFWGIDVGTERPNLAQYVRPMESAANSYLSLIPFIPEDAQTEGDIPKTIIFFRSVAETRDACLAIRALLPSHLHPSIQPFAAPDEESTKEQRLKGLVEGRIRVLCCTIAAGMGCDIPDIEVAVIYGVDSFVSFVQKGGRAGRNGKAGARMVWLVEDWMFKGEGEVVGKRVEERRAKVDPVASEYIHCQGAGSCLRDFMRQVFRPKPEELGLPGFDGGNTSGLEVSWVIEGEEIRPEPGKCCSASSCRAPGSDSNAGELTEAEKAVVQSRHHRIRKVLRNETSAAEGILGPPPGRNGIRCPKEEKAIFRAVLEEWRKNHWESIDHKTVPMLSKAWVLGECNIKQLVDQLRRVINTDKEKIDRKWVRALIDTAASDEAVGGLVAVIQRFHDDFFVRSKEREPRSSKQQKISSSISQRCPPSPAESTFTQDSYLDPNYSPPRYHGSGTSSSQGKRKRVGRSRAVVQQTPQQSPQQLSPQLSLQVTRMLPEPKLVSRLPTSLVPLARTATHPSLYSLSPRAHPYHQPPVATPPIPGSPWHTPSAIYISRPPTQPMSILHPFSQPSPMGTLQPLSPQLRSGLSQPPLLQTPITSQEAQVAIDPQLHIMHSQLRVLAAPGSSQPLSWPPTCSYNPYHPSNS